MLQTYQNQTINQTGFNNELLVRWTAYADVKGNSRTTYNAGVKRFVDYLQTNDIKAPERADVINWRDELLHTLKANTVRNYLAAVKLFFQWLELEGLYKNIAIHVKGVKVDDKFKKDALNMKQCAAVLRAINTDTLKGKRDYAIIRLMMDTGLRTIEVVRADIKDIRGGDDNPVLYVQGKGREDKADFVELTPPVYEAILTYLKARGAADVTEPLFTSTSNKNNNERVTTCTISRVCKSAMIEAGYNSDRLTAHSLRHTAATLMFDNGSTVKEVQEVLRHKNINTTYIYTHMMSRTQNKSVARASAAIDRALEIY